MAWGYLRRIASKRNAPPPARSRALHAVVKLRESVIHEHLVLRAEKQLALFLDAQMHRFELSDLELVAVHQRLGKPARFLENFVAVHFHNRATKELVEGKFDDVFFVCAEFD